MSFIIDIVQGDNYENTAAGDNRISIATTIDFTNPNWTGKLYMSHRVTGAALSPSGSAVAAISSTLLKASISSANTAFPLLTTQQDFGVHPAQIEFTYLAGTAVKTISGAVRVVQSLN